MNEHVNQLLKEVTKGKSPEVMRLAVATSLLETIETIMPLLKMQVMLGARLPDAQKRREIDKDGMVSAILKAAAGVMIKGKDDSHPGYEALKWIVEEY